MEITIQTSPGATILRISGDLRLWGHAEQEQQLTGVIRAVGQQVPERLVFNLAGIKHVDSAGVGALVRMPLSCAKNSVELAVVLPQGVAGEAIRRLRVFDPWPNFADEAAALSSMSPSPRAAVA